MMPKPKQPSGWTRLPKISELGPKLHKNAAANTKPKNNPFSSLFTESSMEPSSFNNSRKAVSIDLAPKTINKLNHDKKQPVVTKKVYIKTDEGKKETNEKNNDIESYEEFMGKMNVVVKKSESPLLDRIWSSSVLNDHREQQLRDSEEAKQVKLKESLEFGSFLSEEAIFAMLKSYEDMIYNELSKLYPESMLHDQFTRTKTQIYMDLPRLSVRKQQRGNDVDVEDSQKAWKSKAAVGEKNKTDDATNELKRKYEISKQLERAMHLYDEIKKKKGELTTSGNRFKSTNLIRDYEKWKKNCFNHSC